MSTNNNNNAKSTTTAATKHNPKKRKVYEVRPDQKAGGWKVMSEGTCLKRAVTKREAIAAARERARNRATDPDFGSNAELRIRNLNGSVMEVAEYAYRPLLFRYYNSI